MALTEATKEAMYLNGFLTKLEFDDSTSGVLFNDNFGAKKLAENATYHARSKHRHSTSFCPRSFKESENKYPSSIYGRYANGHDDQRTI